MPEGTTHEIVTDLRRALPGRLGRPGRAPAAIHSVLAPAPETVDLPLYANEQINTYRSAAPAAIGLRGFLQTDAVYQQGRAAAVAWLDTPLTGAWKVLDIAQVQLFLTELVQDSPTRNHSLARLRGAQGGFRARSFDLKLPPGQLMVTGQLTGPGLDGGAAGLSVPVLQRIRAGVAHPDDRGRDRAQPADPAADPVPAQPALGGALTGQRRAALDLVPAVRHPGSEYVHDSPASPDHGRLPRPGSAAGGPLLRRRVRQHHGAAVRLDEFHV